MPPRPPASRSTPRFPAVAVLPSVLLAAVVLWLAWGLRAERSENHALRAELADLRLARREAASRESLTADSLRRVARLEETLALMRQEVPATPAAAESPEAARAVELERVIDFLRGEIKAAHETIERLKQGDPPRGRNKP